MSALKDESIEELVRHYAEAATSHGRATEQGDYVKGNAAHEVISSVYRELRRRGPDAQRALLDLLGDPEVGVRCWAASHALEFSPADGERVLSELAGVPKSLVSFSAKMTLKQWRDGKLLFP
jgi:hypothetical protein